MPSRYARKKSSADRRSKVLKEGTASAFGSSRANTLRGELTKEAANATDEGRSRHASESLNFFSSSSEPMALAAVERAVSVSRGRRKCHAKALRRAKRTHAHLPDQLLQPPEDTNQTPFEDVGHLQTSGDPSASALAGKLQRRKVACTRLANVGELGSVAPGKDGVHELRLERRDILVCRQRLAAISQRVTVREGLGADETTHPRRPSSWTRLRSWRFFVPLLA